MAIVALIAGFVVNLALIPLIILLAKHFNWYDKRGTRKIHTGNIPRLGGIAIAPIAVGGLLVINRLFALDLPFIAFWPVGAALAIIYIIGVIDDSITLSPHIKLIGQFVAGVLVIAAHNSFPSLMRPSLLAMRAVMFIAILLWIALLTNAINLVDGMDGLAGGISVIAMASIALLRAREDNNSIAIIVCMLIAGALCAFLLFNMPPAKIFLGDGGSLVLGFCFAVLPLLSRHGLIDNIIQTATILCIPLTDVAKAIFRRALHRTAFYQPDREHIHHNLMDIGWTNWQICFGVYGMTLLASGSVWLGIQFPAMRFFLAGAVWAIAITATMAISHRARAMRQSSRRSDNNHPSNPL